MFLILQIPAFLYGNNQKQVLNRRILAVKKPKVWFDGRVL